MTSTLDALLASGERFISVILKPATFLHDPKNKYIENKKNTQVAPIKKKEKN
jgi:hypothetical protein